MQPTNCSCIFCCHCWCTVSHHSISRGQSPYQVVARLSFLCVHTCHDEFCQAQASQLYTLCKCLDQTLTVVNLQAGDRSRLLHATALCNLHWQSRRVAQHQQLLGLHWPLQWLAVGMACKGNPHWASPLHSHWASPFHSHQVASLHNQLQVTALLAAASVLK